MLSFSAFSVGCITEAEWDRWHRDRDADGFQAVALGGLDCDDTDPSVHPGTEEVCDDGVDNDCDGVIDESGVGEIVWYQDDDADGWGRADSKRVRCPNAAAAGWARRPGDCDDTEAGTRPGVAEICDGVDNDCDQVIDEGC